MPIIKPYTKVGWNRGFTKESWDEHCIDMFALQFLAFALCVMAFLGIAVFVAMHSLSTLEFFVKLWKVLP